MQLRKMVNKFMDKFFKILYISEFFSHSAISGASIVAFNNYYMMRDFGNECYFYATNLKPYLEEQSINDFFPESHIFLKDKVSSVKFRLNSLYNSKAKKNLEKVIEEIKPDVIHIHCPVELSFSIILAIKKYKIPYIITIHDPGFVCPILGTGEQKCTLCSKSLLNCVKKKCSRNNYFCSMYVAFKFWINKLLLNTYLPKKLLFPSKALKDYVESTKYRLNVSHSVFPNTLDKEYENIQPNYSNDRYFLFVGSLYNAKGIDILLNAIKDLPKDINFHIVGKGTSESENRYKSFADENNLSNVKFLGQLDRQEILKEYQKCIALIVPSNWFEIFGMINIEAFINGKPVIASDIGGIPEIVEHDKTGLLFEPANAEQLKYCILKYWNNNSLVIEHGKNAYKKAVKLYLGKNTASILNDFYKEVIIR